MRLLVSWVRDFVDLDVPPAVVAETMALRGFEVAAIEPCDAPAPPPWQRSAVRDDAVIDFEVTANRPDCLGVLGLAREIATAFDRPVRAVPRLDAAAPAASTATADVRIKVEDSVGCPRYVAAVADVFPSRTPAWMAARLLAAGVRPISPIVDVTNYVLMEIGHPMHAFDLARLAGRELRIRWARPGEALTTLDGVERRLEPDMLVIADAERAQAVAGVMGGGHSEVSDRTLRVAFESAYFDPATIRRQSKRLGLKTDASARFERGADIGAPVVALERALELMEAIGAGRRVGSPADWYPAPRSPQSITLRRERMGRVLGLSVPDTDAVRILASLGLSPRPITEGWTVTIPTFRVDLTREVDLIEEVGRHYGFDKLEPTFPPMITAAPPPDPRVARDRTLREIATAAGLSEAVTFGFIPYEAAHPFAPSPQDEGVVRLGNPLSAKFDSLRPSLLPGLLEAVAHNRRHGRSNVALFEIGARFTPRQGETRGLAAIWTGAVGPEHWSAPGREVDLFDATGLVERVAAVFRLPVSFVPTEVPYLMPGRAAHAMMSGSPIGVVGRLSPALADASGLPRQDRVIVAEIALEPLSAAVRDQIAVRPLARYPFVVRDLSIVVSERLSAAIIRGTILAAAGDGPAPLQSLMFFDRYQGKGVAAGSVSLSVRLTFQSENRTLTDAEVNDSVEQILRALVQHHQAVQR